MIYLLENIFEEINKGKQMINDFLVKIELWQNWISPDWTDVIYVHQKKLADIELQTQRRVAVLLEKIRRGEAEEQEMDNFLKKFSDENPCSLKSVQTFLKENARIEAKVEALSRFDDSNTTQDDPKKKLNEPNSNILLKKITCIDDFIDKYYDDNVYLLNISHQWEVKDKPNWYKQLRYFNNLRKAEIKSDEKKSIFRVIDYDLHAHLEDKPQTCVIYHVFHGKIDSRDYYHDSRSKFIFICNYISCSY